MEFAEVIKRRRMVHAFTDEPLEPGTADEGFGAVFFGIAPEIMGGFRAQYGIPEE